MRRVVLCDPALKDHRGHHFSLTKAISDACLAYGYKVCWLTNKAFDRARLEIGDAEVYGCFSADTYDGHRQHKESVISPPAAEIAELALPEPDPALRDFDRSAPVRTLLRTYRRLPRRWREETTPRLRHWLLGEPLNLPERAPRKRGPQPLRPEQEIYRGLKQCQATGDDIVLFHTCDAHTYRDVVAFFMDLAHVTEWAGFPAFHLSTPYDEKIMPHNNRYPTADLSISRLKSMGLIGSRVFLHAENELLAKHLAAYFAAPVEALPIPPGRYQKPKARNTVLRVKYLGAARTEKGFLLLPAALKRLLSTDLPAPVEFTVQITPQIMGYTPDVELAVAALRKLAGPRLRLLEQPLSQHAFDIEVADADVLLLPYQRDRYEVRGSGLAVEGVVSAAVLLATANTFPAFIGGDAAITLATPTSEELVEALVTVLSDPDSWQQKSLARSEWYRAMYGGGFLPGALAVSGGSVDASVVPGAVRYEDETEWQPLIRG